MVDEENASMNERENLNGGRRLVETVGTRAGTPQCPECGSGRIRGRFRPFLVNLGLGVTFWLLTPVGVPLYQNVPLLMFLLFGGAVVCLVVLPVTLAIAVAGRYRCRDCGRRFRLGQPLEGASADDRFPVSLAVLAVSLFGVTVLVGLVLIVTVPHRPESVMALGVLGRIVIAALLAGLGVLLQTILWRVLRTRVKDRRTLTVCLLLPFIVLSVLWVTGACLDRKVFLRHVQPEARAERILLHGQLAALPESATDIEVHSWSSPFSGEEFLRFAAEPDDIERFLAESPNLKGKEPTLYSAEHMRMPIRDDMQKRWELEQAGHEVYIPHPATPDWYMQEIKGPARRYIFRPERYQFDAELIIDDEQHVVYVYLCFS